MNLNTIKIKNTKAPTMKHPKRSVSKYVELFNSMKAGQWFTINSKDKMKFNAAGSKYVKGRYSLYKHPTMDCKYVFRMNK